MQKTLNSGASLEITRSPFEISHRLFKAIMKEIKTVNVQLGLKEDQSLRNLFDLELTDETINTVKNTAVSLLSSQEIEDVLWECMNRATYNGTRITKNLFDDEEAAGDYLEIAKEVLVLNAAPFFKSLNSLFPSMPVLKTTDTQKSKLAEMKN